MIRKLKSRAGESLVESMAAILIFTMSSIIMYTMVTTAGGITQNTKDLEAQIQSELVAVEQGHPDIINGKGELHIILELEDHATKNIADIDMVVYGGQEDNLYAFYVDSTTAPTETTEGGG